MTTTPDDPFFTWLRQGIDNGWCSEPLCETHDGVPMTDVEDELFDNGVDVCINVIRLYGALDTRPENVDLTQITGVFARGERHD